MGDSVTMGGHERLIMATRAYRFLTAHLIAPWALQGVRPQGEVLEIGAGAGAMAAHLLATTPELHMVVTDVDPEMCTLAARALRRYETNVTVEQADANDLHYADDSFDFVLSFLMLHHTGDWRAPIRQAMRVLRPGGLLVGFDIAAGAPLHHPERMATVMKQGELEAFLSTVPEADPHIRPGIAKRFVRFVVSKKGA